MALTADEILAVKGEPLEHSGVTGMHWGQRRYQNPDGSLTALGRIHYGIGKRREARAAAKKTKVMQSGDAKTVLKYRKKLTDEEFDTAMARVAKTEALKAASNAEKNAKKQAKQQAKLTKEQRKSAEKIAEANAKTKTNSKDFWGTLGEWGKRAATIASLYKSVSTITTGFGIDMPKFGIKDKSDKKSGASSTAEPKTESPASSFTKTNSGPAGREEGMKWGVKSSTFSEVNKDALRERDARKSSEGLGSRFVPSLSSNDTKTGSSIVGELLSGTVEGTGTHFKNATTSSFSNSTLSLGMDIVSDILALPYDPNKKF